MEGWKLYVHVYVMHKVDIDSLSTSSMGLRFADFGFDLIRQIADLNLAVASC